MTTTESVYRLLPEIAVALSGVAVYTAGAFWTRAWKAVGIVGLAAAAFFLSGDRAGLTALPPFSLDALAFYGRWAALVTGGLLWMTAATSSGRSAEYVGSLLLATAGAMLAVSANELVALFTALELISVPTYILLYLGRNDGAGREATAKYFYLSVFSSALLLYGFSFLYGVAGSTDLMVIHDRLAAGDGGGLAKIALAMVVAGLGFRVTAVPFHFYAADVYQGTSHSNAALLSVLPKLAGMIVLVRVVVVAMPQMEPYGWRLAAILAAASMLLGNLLALWQDHLRRLLAYSSIAHSGYMLLGVATALVARRSAAGFDGIAAMLFYVVAYAAATIGCFAVLVYLGGDRRPVESVDDLAGLAKTRPLAALLLATFLFSLTGIPPLAGFWGKLLLFSSTLGVEGPGGGLRAWFIALAVLGVLASAISAGYYLRIIAVMYFRTPLAEPRAAGGTAAYLVALACGILVVALGLGGQPLLRAAQAASPTAARGGVAVLPVSSSEIATVWQKPDRQPRN